MTLYDLAKWIIWRSGRVLWRIRAIGEENVPLQGALIVACNHVSLLDPPILGAACPRRINYMAKRQLFNIPLFGGLIRRLGAYPVDRDGSAAGAIKRSIDVLRRGEAIGIFPEGGRNLHGEAQARHGVALLASLANAPVMPAAIVGSNRAVRFGTVSVVFGTPLQLDSSRKATREDLAKFTDAVMEQIHTLAQSVSRAGSSRA